MSPIFPHGGLDIYEYISRDKRHRPESTRSTANNNYAALEEEMATWASKNCFKMFQTRACMVYSIEHMYI
jgi:hypothetical protein